MWIYIFWEKNVNICAYLDGIVTCMDIINTDVYEKIVFFSAVYPYSITGYFECRYTQEIYGSIYWIAVRYDTSYSSVRRCLFRQTCLMRLKSIFRPSLFVTLFKCNSISQINTYNLSNIILFEIANLPVLHGCYDGFLYKDSAAFSSLLLYVGNCEII